MKITQLDLHVSASKAALATLDLKGTYELDKAAQTAFDSEKQDPADWTFWRDQFLHQRNNYLTMRTWRPASVIAAESVVAKTKTPEPTKA